MKLATTFAFSLFVAGFAALAVTFIQPEQAVAADKNEKSETSKTTTNNAQKSGASYNYTAQAGDSYSQMARKAVQTYGINNKVNLSQAQILFTETNLTQAAGSPYLMQEQKVTIAQSAVKEWVDKAKQLNAATVAAWNAYVPGVNFNTNKVGEA